MQTTQLLNLAQASVAQLREAIHRVTAAHPFAHHASDAQALLDGIDVIESDCATWEDTVADFKAVRCKA